MLRHSFVTTHSAPIPLTPFLVRHASSLALSPTSALKTTYGGGYALAARPVVAVGSLGYGAGCGRNHRACGHGVCDGNRPGRAAFRRILLATLRLSVIGLVLLMIAQWVLELNPTQLPYLVVMVDDSQSMKIVDHYDKESSVRTLPDGSKRPVSKTSRG